MNQRAEWRRYANIVQQENSKGEKESLDIEVISKKLPVTKAIATRSKDAIRGSWHYYE